jgi:hypothetical protein
MSSSNFRIIFLCSFRNTSDMDAFLEHRLMTSDLLESIHSELKNSLGIRLTNSAEIPVAMNSQKKYGTPSFIQKIS